MKDPIIRSIREVLAESGMDPIEEMIGLVNDLSSDKEMVNEDLPNDPHLRRELILSAIDLDKLKLKALQNLNDARQREDDQAIKIQDQRMRKEELEAKRNESRRGSGEVVNEYMIPRYDKQLIDGKYRLIRLESE